MKSTGEMSTGAVALRNAWRIAPLADPRWERFVQRHASSSVFHSLPWLEALRRTYGYEPVAFTASSIGDELANALLFCRVNSWMTGKRLVSLPFSDHCQPLTDDDAACENLFRAAEEEMISQRLRYLEVRPLRPATFGGPMFRSSSTYWIHFLDLTPDADSLFAGFHKDSVQRKVRRAEREGLGYAEGRDAKMLSEFFELMIQTRRRHRLPPQPKAWFRNLGECFGEALKIRTAYHGRQPVASILTIRFKNVLVYKYGCSDEARNNLGGTQLLFWRAIQEAKSSGLTSFDLGRSDQRQAGLVTFKDRWGARRESLEYVRFTASAQSPDNYRPASTGWKASLTGKIVRWLPSPVLCRIGSVLYKHIG